MVTYVKMPKVDLTMKQGTVVNWFKNEGEKVEKGEALLEIETQKIVSEVESPASGILRKIVALEGADVLVDGILGIITASDEEPPLMEVTLHPEAKAEEGEEIKKSAAPSVSKKDIQISPLARKLAKEHEINILSIKSTGSDKRITKKDVLEAIEKKKAVTEPERVAKTISLTGMRKTISERLSHSYRNAVHTVLTTRIDMTEAIELRKELLAKKERITEAPLTYTGLLVKAVATALKDHPIINSTLEGNKIKVLSEINIGVAVALEEGLIVPVVHNADKKSISEIALCLKKLTEKAQEHLLSLDEVSRGTFTITNLGMYGISTFQPIINPPESAILGVGTIEKRPFVIKGQIIVRSAMNLSLVFDHRVFGGAEGAKFLQTLKRILEKPSMLLSKGD